MRLGLEAVAQPVLAANRHVEQRRTEVDERHVEPAPVKGDDRLVMLRHIPKRCQQLDLVHARHELHRSGLVRCLLVVHRREKHLAARGVGIQHADAHDLGSQGPEIELPVNFGLAGGACRFVGYLFALAEQVFLLRFVELLQRQRGSLYVEYESSHAKPGFVTLPLKRITSWAAVRG